MTAQVKTGLIVKQDFFVINKTHNIHKVTKWH